MEEGKKEREGSKNIRTKKDGEVPTTSTTVWFSLKRSLHCKSDSSDVYDPVRSRKPKPQQFGTILTRKVVGGRSGCSRSIANLRDVIHGSKRHIEKPTSCSPRSIGSSEFLNPIVHEVILSNSKIAGFCGQHTDGYSGGNDGGGGVGNGGSTFVDKPKPGTPGPGGHYPTMMLNYNNSNKTSSSSVHANASSRKSPAFFEGSRHRKASLEIDAHKNGSSSSVVTCHRCGEQFKKWDALEAHHLSKHAVTELLEGDSSRKIVEIICRTSWPSKSAPSNRCGRRIERVLKVHNMQKTIARFEEYRETVKMKANKLSKKHPRCLADGNELLRFYGTTLACSLGLNGSSSLCVSEKCRVCRIIRHGFEAGAWKKGVADGKGGNGMGVFTASTSERAFEGIEIGEEEGLRKGLIVCRVIAGRVHRPVDSIQELVGLQSTGFDSVAGKVGLCSNTEELYLLSPRALLPCFVVICKP